MIGLLDVLQDVIQRFDKIGIEYFLVGSVASMYYGRPRFTQDLDLVVRIRARQVAEIEDVFPIEEYYCPPREILADELLRKGSFNLIHQGSGIKVDMVLDKETEFYLAEFTRKKRIEMAPGLFVYIASPEDLILNKLDYYREGASDKHLKDIKDILVNTQVDESYIRTWAERLKLLEQWEKI